MEKQFFMVYAEGQGAPTYKHENEQAASKEAERLAEKLGVNTTVLQAVKMVAPKDITKRVKTYADACAVLGIEPMNETVLAKLGFTKDEIAYRKLKTMPKPLTKVGGRIGPIATSTNIGLGSCIIPRLPAFRARIRIARLRLRIRLSAPGFAFYPLETTRAERI